MFDLAFGLPVHVLVVHAVVVGVPVAALVSLAAAAAVVTRPARWRWAVPLAAVVDVGALALAWVASESGEALQALLPNGQAPEIVEHAELGESLTWYVLALLASAVLLAVLRGRRALAAVASALVLAASVAAVVQVVRVGHSGSSAVWGYVEGQQAG